MTGLPTYLSCTGCGEVDKIPGSAEKIIGTPHKYCKLAVPGRWRITSTEQYQHREAVFKAPNCTQLWRNLIRTFCNIDYVFIERQGKQNKYKAEVMDGGTISNSVLRALDNLENDFQAVKVQAALGDEDYQIIYLEMVL